MPQRRRVGRALSALTVAAMSAAVLWPRELTATIEEQRARLPPPPPPGQCPNPIEGVWKSLRWYPGNAAWYSFELEIHMQGNRLTGRINAHSWDTPPNRPEPGPCTGDLSHWLVVQTAEGSVDGMRLDFAANRWAVGQVFCGSRPYAYNLDHFRGVIDPSIQEFQSVNNDGGLQIDEPTVFRRIRCFEPPTVPHPVVEPPNFQPPRRRMGCSR
ncbi:MAG: hypothetical protein JNK72_23170 [Myxococcales bacterium]|nr:hypothetical protein [Myxococcales bacterium]